MPSEIKVVVGAGEYNKGEDWIHTQEEDLSLLNEENWRSRFFRTVFLPFCPSMFGSI
ncbi:hypothetical protein J2TS4_10300 [Paenibacillus sp. J2TS4]|nr:hypothetical protein J2TS4_10300 [Paenibacillus sp. J2TS4]